MTPAEAADLLAQAKWVMSDMGLGVEAGEAEDAELRLLQGCTAEQARAYADHLLPPGRRGRVWLVLLPPPAARARAFIAAVLRAVGEP